MQIRRFEDKDAEAVSVVTVEPVLCTDPDKVAAVLQNTVDHVLGQPVLYLYVAKSVWLPPQRQKAEDHQDAGELH